MESARKVLLVVVAMLALVATDAAAGGFLKIEGINRESTDQDHVGWIEVESWDWGIERSKRTGGGSSPGSSRVDFRDLSFAKLVDSATPMLMLKCAEGSRLREAVLDVPLNGDRIGKIRLIMSNVQVTSVHVEETAGEDRPSEHISITFTEVKAIYEGSLGTVEFGWDIGRGRAL